MLVKIVISLCKDKNTVCIHMFKTSLIKPKYKDNAMSEQLVLYMYIVINTSHF